MTDTLQLRRKMATETRRGGSSGRAGVDVRRMRALLTTIMAIQLLEAGAHAVMVVSRTFHLHQRHRHQLHPPLRQHRCIRWARQCHQHRPRPPDRRRAGDRLPQHLHASWAGGQPHNPFHASRSIAGLRRHSLLRSRRHIAGLPHLCRRSETAGQGNLCRMGELGLSAAVRV